MHLKNLHDLLQSGCSEHLHLHLRIFRDRDLLSDLFLQHNWDFSYSFSELPQFSVPSASLAPASRFQESQSKIEYDSSSAFCTVRIGDSSLCRTCGNRTVGINFCTFTEMSTKCSLVNLHGFSGRLGQLESVCATGILNLLNFCSIGHLVDSPGCSATVSLHLHLDSVRGVT